ncbi:MULTISPECIES: hypothetical protein [unclassified Brevundimonas]|uniref:hypothetical protein n=1 Tax=unclassified Brevundimonas TaxID=2622653 RepID=UPI0025B82150|nr:MULTISPECIES: hypothetical protein [unclassified Brevundimonas]
MNMPPLGGEAIAGIVSLLLVLVLWTRSLLAKRASDEALNQKLLERQERIDAERARNSAPQTPPPTDGENGPWD